MTAKGTFEVNLTPQADKDFPAGRMTIDKTYHGEMSGSGVGQMISKRAEAGTAIYYAIEEFCGSVNGRSGSFTLGHQGRMNAVSQTLEITIVDGSGGGELKGIAGSMRIGQDEDGHSYELEYELQDK